MARPERRPPRRAAAHVVAVASVALMAGCTTSEEPGVPVECRSSAEQVERSLASAPGPVTLDGVPISACFARQADQADMQAVGLALTGAAAGLADEARERPEGDAALRLGYLVGAVREGAEAGGGIHDELVRRLEQELVGVDTDADAFRDGERAGRESG